MKKYAIILAAGKGTRMKSHLPKVLHPVCGKPMLQHIVDKLTKMKFDEIVVVVGHKSELVKEKISGPVTFVEQNEQLGTAHATLQAEPILKNKEGTTVVLTGDTPLIEIDTIRGLINSKMDYVGTVLTTIQHNPSGYGRIIRNEVDETVFSIIEEKDANDAEKSIKEVNTGIFCFDNIELFKSLPKIENSNAQSEYYLTDIVSHYTQQGIPFNGYLTNDNLQTMGINSKVQLSEAEKELQGRINTNHMINGVTIIDPDNTYIESEVEIESDSVIYPNVIIKGATKIGRNCTIHSGTEIEDTIIGDNVTIKHSFISSSTIHNNVTVGPFAHIRPSSEISDGAKIGNFVELKNTFFGENSKVSHLSYIGDSDVGKNVNLGCGSITVNYDGTQKHRTTIQDNVFVGCNSNLIAPVTLEENSYIAAGSTINKDVPKDSLAIAREKQTNKENYANKIKRKG